MNEWVKEKADVWRSLGFLFHHLLLLIGWERRDAMIILLNNKYRISSIIHWTNHCVTDVEYVTMKMLVFSLGCQLPNEENVWFWPTLNSRSFLLLLLENKNRTDFVLCKYIQIRDIPKNFFFNCHICQNFSFSKMRMNIPIKCTHVTFHLFFVYQTFNNGFLSSLLANQFFGDWSSCLGRINQWTCLCQSIARHRIGFLYISK